MSCTLHESAIGRTVWAFLIWPCTFVDDLLVGGDIVLILLHRLDYRPRSDISVVNSKSQYSQMLTFIVDNLSRRHDEPEL